MLDLNELVDPESGWLLTNARGISECGQIVGWWIIDGDEHAYLLTPVPEPGTVTLLLLGLAAAARRLRRSWRAQGSVLQNVSRQRPTGGSPVPRYG